MEDLICLVWWKIWRMEEGVQSIQPGPTKNQSPNLGGKVGNTCFFLLGIYFLGSLFSFSLTNTHSRKIEIFSIILLFYTSFNFYPVTFHSPN